MEQQNLFVSENISRIEEEIVKFQAELEELDKNKDHASDEIKEKEDKIKSFGERLIIQENCLMKLKKK